MDGVVLFGWLSMGCEVRVCCVRSGVAGWLRGWRGWFVVVGMVCMGVEKSLHGILLVGVAVVVGSGAERRVY